MVRNEDLVIQKMFALDGMSCQRTCYTNDTCTEFSFLGSETYENCVLLLYDYRQGCQDAAGLMVNLFLGGTLRIRKEVNII